MRTEDIGTKYFCINGNTTFQFELHLYNSYFCAISATMITPEQVKRVLSSEVARNVEAVLKSDGPRADHVDMFRMCRNYLMFRILLANGQRSGVLLSLTPKIIKTAKLCQAGAVLTVSCLFFSLLHEIIISQILRSL